MKSLACGIKRIIENGGRPGVIASIDLRGSVLLHELVAAIPIKFSSYTAKGTMFLVDMKVVDPTPAEQDTQIDEMLRSTWARGLFKSGDTRH